MGWILIHVLGWPKSSFQSIRCYRKTHTNFLTKPKIFRFLMRIYLYNSPFKKKKQKKTLLLFPYSSSQWRTRMTSDSLVYQGRTYFINTLPATADTFCPLLPPTPTKKGNSEKQPRRDVRKIDTVAWRELCVCCLNIWKNKAAHVNKNSVKCICNYVQCKDRCL